MTYHSKIEPDARINDHGSIVLITPLSSEAKVWLDDNTPRSAIYWGGAIVVEHRYADNMIAGMILDGLEVA
jgi:hypothetical protein